MKISNKTLILTATIGLMTQWNTSADNVLKRRYSFSETNGTVVADSIGGAAGSGIVKGGDVKWSGGQLDLPGGPNQSDGAYVELPEKIISSLSTVTIETWATWKDASEEPWERIFDFGSSEEGKGKAGKGFSYLMLTTKRAGDEVASVEQTRNPDDDPDKIVLLGNSSPTVDKEYYYAIVYDPGANASKFYVNGKLAATDKAARPLSKINDVNNWLGRSQWADNSLFKGSFNEVRIWEGALTADQIADHQKAGPDQKLEPKLPGKESKETNSDETKNEAGKKDEPRK